MVEFSSIKLANPLVAAAATPTKDFENVMRCVEAGVGAVVLKSVASDKLSLMRSSPRPRFKLLDFDRHHEKIENFNLYSIEQAYPGTIEDYTELIRKLNQAVGIPILGSVIALELSEWVSICKELELAGAAGVEINISCPHRLHNSEHLIAEIFKAVSSEVSIPLILKLSPFQDIKSTVKAVDGGGCSGLTLCNRLTGLDIDIKTMRPIMHGSFAGFGGPWSKYFLYKIVAEVAQSTGLPIMASGGVISSEDVIKYILLGATCVQVGSAIILNGFDKISQILAGLEDYLSANSINSYEEIRGKALKNIIPLNKIDREKVAYAHIINKRCVGCGRCLQVCFYGALKIIDGLAAEVDEKLCDGCGLCAEICPYYAIEILS